MNLDLSLEGQDADEKLLFALNDWIRKEQIDSLSICRKTATASEEHMGVSPNEVLSIVLGSAAVVELTRSLHVWLKSGRRKLKLKIKHGTSECEFNAQNVPGQTEIAKAILNMLKKSQK